MAVDLEHEGPELAQARRGLEGQRALHRTGVAADGEGAEVDPQLPLEAALGRQAMQLGDHLAAEGAARAGVDHHRHRRAGRPYRRRPGQIKGDLLSCARHHAARPPVQRGLDLFAVLTRLEPAADVVAQALGQLADLELLQAAVQGLVAAVVGMDLAEERRAGLALAGGQLVAGGSERDTGPGDRQRGGEDEGEAVDLHG